MNSKYFPIHTLPSSHLPKTHDLSPSGDFQMLGTVETLVLYQPLHIAPLPSGTVILWQRMSWRSKASMFNSLKQRSQIIKFRFSKWGPNLWGLNYCGPAWGAGASVCVCSHSLALHSLSFGHNHWTLLSLRGVSCSDQPVGQSMCIPWACLLHNISPLCDSSPSL